MTPREVSQVVWANVFAAVWREETASGKLGTYEKMKKARILANEASSAANEMALFEQSKDPEGVKGWWR